MKQTSAKRDGQSTLALQASVLRERRCGGQSATSIGGNKIIIIMSKPFDLPSSLESNGKFKNFI